jgi:hypothetical protein
MKGGTVIYVFSKNKISPGHLLHIISLNRFIFFSLSCSPYAVGNTRRKRFDDKYRSDLDIEVISFSQSVTQANTIDYFCFIEIYIFITICNVYFSLHTHKQVYRFNFFIHREKKIARFL